MAMKELPRPGGGRGVAAGGGGFGRGRRAARRLLLHPHHDGRGHRRLPMERKRRTRGATCRSPSATRSPCRRAGRIEIGLADGNVLFLGGGTHAAFDSLYDQQGEDDEFSAIRLTDGEVALRPPWARPEIGSRASTPTTRASISRPARACASTSDPRRGTVVIGRAGLSGRPHARREPTRSGPGSTSWRAGTRSRRAARGVFSRDRFDIWVADRLETLDDTRASRRATSARNPPATSPRSTATGTGTTTPLTEETSGLRASTLTGARIPRVPGTTRRRA